MSERSDWHRQRRLSRRTVLSASARAGVGAAGLALVGCGDDDDDDQAAAQTQPDTDEQVQQAADQAADQTADQAAEPPADDTEPEDTEPDEAVAAGGPRPGGIYRATTDMATHDYWDPHRSVFGPTQSWNSHMLNKLIRWRNQEQAIMEADLANLPEIPDDETYVFTIVDGARFWDAFPTEGGRAFTADDVRFNIQRQIEGVDATGVQDGTFIQSSNYQRTASMDVIDDRTIQLQTNGPDATYLGVHMAPFNWLTSPEAVQEFGDSWRDETYNLQVSGTGPNIPVSFEADSLFELRRNPDYWKSDDAGQQLPYRDGIQLFQIVDPSAQEAAFRNRQIFAVGGSRPVLDAIQGDFPDVVRRETVFGFPINTFLNFNEGYDFEDGLGNPYLDRRFAMAWHMAVDPYLLIDAVYLGDAKPSGVTGWFNSAWAMPEEQLITVPGYRPNRDEDVTELRGLIEASGFDTSRTMRILMPDLFETTYAGITETIRNMYEVATGISTELEITTYATILQRLSDGSLPGQAPAWTNAPSDLDPTTSFNAALVPGGSTNLAAFSYDYPPVTELVQTMAVTLDLQERIELFGEVEQILLGVHPDHGLDGITFNFLVMNGIAGSLIWPFFHPDPDVYQFAWSTHNHERSWIDVDHPDYPA